MEFGVKKCAMLVMRRGRLVKSEGLVLPDENKIRVIGENNSYKYLGVLEADKIKLAQFVPESLALSRS